ncbi:MAG: hypothetical protein AAFX94_06400, partial [Myxococcota bacterium]
MTSGNLHLPLAATAAGSFVSIEGEPRATELEAAADGGREDRFLIRPGPSVDLSPVEGVPLAIPAAAPTPTNNREASEQHVLAERFTATMGGLRLSEDAAHSYAVATSHDEAMNFMFGPDSPVAIDDEAARRAMYEVFLTDVYNYDRGMRAPPPVVFQPTEAFLANRAAAIETRVHGVGAGPAVAGWQSFGGDSDELVPVDSLGQFGPTDDAQLVRLSSGWTVASAALFANRDTLRTLAGNDSEELAVFALALALTATVLNDSRHFGETGLGTGSTVVVPNLAVDNPVVQQIFRTFVDMPAGEREDALRHYRLERFQDSIAVRFHPNALDHAFPPSALDALTIAALLTAAAHGAESAEPMFTVVSEPPPAVVDELRREILELKETVPVVETDDA